MQRYFNALIDIYNRQHLMLKGGCQYTTKQSLDYCLIIAYRQHA